MNVLSAEAEVSYDKLIEMDEINPRFKDTDPAMIVGACDVVNPAAIETEGTPSQACRSSWPIRPDTCWYSIWMKIRDIRAWKTPYTGKNRHS